MSGSLAQLFAPASAPGLPQVPDESLWPFLDAASRCVSRFGLARTSIRDIATEAGVERTTVYRRVGSVHDVFRLLIARELHLLVTSLPDDVPEGADGGEFAVELLARAVEQCQAHPVIGKVLRDEPDLVAGFAVQGLAGLVERITEAVTPMLAQAMELSLVQRRDAGVIAEWIARIGLSLLLVPPRGDLRSFLREVLEPALRVQPIPEPAP